MFISDLKCSDPNTDCTLSDNIARVMEMKGSQKEGLAI